MPDDGMDNYENAFGEDEPPPKVYSPPENVTPQPSYQAPQKKRPYQPMAKKLNEPAQKSNLTSGSGGRPGVQAELAEPVSKKYAIFIAVLTCAGLGIFAIITTVLPIIKENAVAPPWAVQFKAAKAALDWGKSKEGMNAAITTGKADQYHKKQLALIEWEYGKALWQHAELTDAEAALSEAALTAAKSDAVDTQIPALLLQGTCQHELLEAGLVKSVDVRIAEKVALLLKDHPNAQQQSYYSLLSGQLHGDTGNLELANKDFDDAQDSFKRANDIEHVKDVLNSRWYALMESIVVTVSAIKPPDIERGEISTGHAKDDRETIVLAKDLYDKHKFKDLEKLIAEADTSRKQYPTGRELVGKIYEEIVDLTDADQFEVWQEKREALEAWCKLSPHSPIPRIAIAKYYNNYAWQLRGADWSEDSKLKMDEWISLYGRLYKGAEALKEAAQLKPLYSSWFPIAQLNYLSASTNKQKAVYENLYQAGTKFFPNSMPIYFGKVHYLQPRWHGESDQWIKMLTKKADSLGGSAGNVFYARAVWSVADLFDDVFRENPSLSRKRVNQGLDDLKTEFGQIHMFDRKN
jgi:hypothetical protein